MPSASSEQTTRRMPARHSALLRHALGDPLIRYMETPGVTEVMANPDGKIFVEDAEKGKHDTGLRLSPRQAARIVQIAAAIDDMPATSEVSCELSEWNARFQGWLPPVVKQACFAIRLHVATGATLEALKEAGTVTETQVGILRRIWQSKKNLIISGATGSGKTTLANAILNAHRDTNDRILVLEDTPELQMPGLDVVSLRTGETVTMRQLVRGALRMRPDRIIVGELRDGAALELLKAWNTGHSGGLSTIHANSGLAALARLEDLVREASANVPPALLAHSVDFIAHMDRAVGGQRILRSIERVEVIGGGQYRMTSFEL